MSDCRLKPDFKPPGRQSHLSGYVSHWQRFPHRRFHKLESPGDDRIPARDFCRSSAALRLRGWRIVEECVTDIPRQRAAVKLLHQSEHHFEGRSRACSRKKWPGDHNAVRSDVDFFVPRGEVFQILPVNGRRLTIEQTGARKHPWPAINPRNNRSLGGEAAQCGTKGMCGLDGCPEAGADKNQIDFLECRQRWSRHVEPRGEPRRFAARSCEAPAKQDPPCPAIGRAHRVHSGGQRQHVRVVENEDCRIERA